MTFPLGLILGMIVTGIALGALAIPTEEGREIGRTVAGLLAFWILLFAVLN
jgi:hypothetical protein